MSQGRSRMTVSAPRGPTGEQEGNGPVATAAAARGILTMLLHVLSLLSPPYPPLAASGTLHVLIWWHPSHVVISWWDSGSK